MLTNARVAEIIGTEQKRMLSNARLDADRLKRIAVTDVRRLVCDGELLPIEDIPDDLAPAIASIEVATKGDYESSVLED